MILRSQLAFWVAFLLPVAFAVYADEAFHTDFQHALLGIPQQHTTFFHRPSSSSKASLLYSLTEKGVLGAINPKDGALVWRQILTVGQGSSVAGAGEGCLRAGEGDSTVVSGLGSLVRAWNAQDGRLVWNMGFAGYVKDLEVLELEDAKKQAGAKDLVLLMDDQSRGVVRRLSGADGRVLWEYTDANDIPFEVSASAENIFLITLQIGMRNGFKIKVTSLDPLTGKQKSHYTLATDSDISAPWDIVFVGANTAAPIIAWTDPAVKTLKVNIIGSKHVSSLSIPNNSGEDIERVTLHAPHMIKSLPHFLVHYQTKSSHWAEVYHVNLKSSAATQAYSLPKISGKGVFSVSTQDANVFFVRTTESEVSVTASVSHGVLARWPKARQDLEINDEYSLSAVSEVVARDKSSYAVRTAHVTSDGYWSLIRNGEATWARAELLTGIVASAWADLPSDEALAKELEAEVEKNPLQAYIHRVRRHIHDLQYLPGWVQSLPTRIIESFLGTSITNAKTAGDPFGFRKVAVVATDNGHLLGLDASDQGKIRWDLKVEDVQPGKTWQVKGIFPSESGLLTVVTEDGGIATLTSDGQNFTLGEGLTKEQRISDIKPIELKGEKVISIFATEDGEALLSIPSSSELNELSHPIAIVKRGKAAIAGLQLSQDTSSAIWQFQAPSGEEVLSVAARPIHDPVASIGRALGDRSVKYKYLNPNLVAVTTVAREKKTMTVSVLDGASGHIVHTVTHLNVDLRAPKAAAISENWLVYSFSSYTRPGASPPHRLHVVELFESSLTNDRGPLGSASNYSSFLSPNSPPSILAQAFVLTDPLSSITITQTLQGITTRSLLCTSLDTPGIFSIPRAMIDPRRPIGRDPTPAEQEEGLMKYSPLLEINPAWMISHKREVWVDKVEVLPALVESTSLVLAWGLDVFGTRVAPIGTFDILGKSFGKLSLIGTIIALAVGVGAVAPIVRKKQINGLWTVS